MNFIEGFLWEEREIRITKAAYIEMNKLDMDVYDIIYILREGDNCEKSRRKRGIRERCSTWRRKRIRVVAALDYCRNIKDECWAITHVAPYKK